MVNIGINNNNIKFSYYSMELSVFILHKPTIHYKYNLKTADKIVISPTESSNANTLVMTTIKKGQSIKISFSKSQLYVTIAI